MDESRIERNARRALPAVRLFQVYMPLPLTRWVEKRSSTTVRPPEGVAHKVISADGVRCEWFIPEQSPAESRAALPARRRLHLWHVGSAPRHGGNAGPQNGCACAHGGLSPCAGTLLSRATGRLRHRISLAAEAGHPRAKLAIAGDSAGGNLTLTTMMQLRDAGEPLPAAAACLSPAADLSDRGESITGYRDPVLHPRAMAKYSAAYVAGNDGRNPLISPVYGDWHGLPPLLIHVGEDEILREDALRVEELARAAGVDVRLEIYPRMWHVWQIYAALPQTERSLNDIAQFLKSHLAAQQG